MPEEGFSFFEIQTPWKIQPSTNQKVPRNPANFETPSLFFRPKIAYNFRNQFRIDFRPILWVAMFDNLAAKFWILPGKVMNLAARYRAMTYREYVDIAPTGVSTQPPWICPLPL